MKTNLYSNPICHIHNHTCITCSEMLDWAWTQSKGIWCKAVALSVCLLTGCSITTIRKFFCGVSCVSIHQLSIFFLWWRQILQHEDLAVKHAEMQILIRIRESSDNTLCLVTMMRRSNKLPSPLTCSPPRQALGSLLQASWGNSWRRRTQPDLPTSTWSLWRTRLPRRSAESDMKQIVIYLTKCTLMCFGHLAQTSSRFKVERYQALHPVLY